MSTHILKTDSIPYRDVAAGVKRFEIRRDDRGYAEGDQLILKETLHTGAEMAAGSPLEYTGAGCSVVVTHILRGPVYGLQDGWVIMSITDVVIKNDDVVFTSAVDLYNHLLAHGSVRTNQWFISRDEHGIWLTNPYGIDSGLVDDSVSGCARVLEITRKDNNDFALGE